MLVGQNLEEYSRDELIALLMNVEERYHSKNERLKSVTIKLAKARTMLKSQKDHLQKYRRKIVGLSYPHGHKL
jgi:predicted nuclease with TOPRIM domain